MDASLQRLIAERPKDMASRDRLILKIMRRVLGTPTVPVGFQHRSEFISFEKEAGRFPTSDAIAAPATGGGARDDFPRGGDGHVPAAIHELRY